MTTDADRIDALLDDVAVPGSGSQWPHLANYETKFIMGAVPMRVLANAPVGTWVIYQVKEGVRASEASLHIAALGARGTNKLSTQTIYGKAYRGKATWTLVKATVVERPKEK